MLVDPRGTLVDQVGRVDSPTLTRCIYGFDCVCWQIFIWCSGSGSSSSSNSSGCGGYHNMTTCIHDSSVLDSRLLLRVAGLRDVGA